MNKSHINKLLIKIATGDQHAFEQLYMETRKGVFSFLYTYLHNYHDSEDAMQEVYLKIKRYISYYKPGTNGPAWILQIAKNHALNELNRQNRHQTIDIEDVVVASEKDEISDIGYITALMQRILSEEDQRILTMHILWGYKHREIAAEMQCPTGTITSRYKRAIDKLKKALKDE